MTKEIQLTKGFVSKVDDDDFEWISKNKWCIDGRGYVVRKKPFSVGGKIILHREITKCPTGMEVDHINGDKLDNRKENLRNTFHWQNGRNLSMKKNNTSGANGVVFDKRRNKYFATIMVGGKSKFLGYYSTFEEAVIARKEGDKKYFGEFRRNV